MAREGQQPATLEISGEVEKIVRGIDTARLFPDYSKLYAVRLPDIAGVAAASLPDMSKLVLGPIPEFAKLGQAVLSGFRMPDLTKVALGLDTAKLTQDYARILGAAAVPDVSKLMAGVALTTGFPDYSKLFGTLDSAAIRREYEAAMPAATEAAEAVVIEELNEIEPTARVEDVWDWISNLPPERKHHLAQRIEVAVAAMVGLAGVAMDQKYVKAAGMLLALAAALHAVFLFIKDETGSEADQPEG